MGILGRRGQYISEWAEGELRGMTAKNLFNI